MRIREDLHELSVRCKPDAGVVEHIVARILPLIPEVNRDTLVKFHLYDSLKHARDLESWQAIGRATELIPLGDRWHFFKESLPLTLAHRPDPVLLHAAVEVARLLPESVRENLYRYGLPAALSQGLTPARLEEQIERSKSYLERLGSTYFAGKIVAENFGRLAHLQSWPTRTERLSFKKTHGRIIALAGKHLGKIIRIITPREYAAWKAAHDHGVPCEPILKVRKSQYRVMVMTEHVGERADHFMQLHPEHAREVLRQMDAIRDRLETAGVLHGHRYPRNHAVQLDKDGKPVVRVIDFDLARLVPA